MDMKCVAVSANGSVGTKICSSDEVLLTDTWFRKSYDAFMSREKEAKKNKSAITCYKILAENKVIKVDFADGKSEKVICDDQDTFDLKTGLYIAIAKHLYKETMTLEGIEQAAKQLSYLKEYVKMVENAIKEHNRNIEKQELCKQQAEEMKKIAHEKRMMNDKKKREHKIEIMQEAFLRALREFGEVERSKE